MTHKLYDYVKKWNLSEPKPLAVTATSHIYTVRAGATTVVLKLLTEVGEEERVGAAALRYWNGRGAVRLLRADAQAQLLEYAEGDDLVALVRQGDDEAATAIIADVLNELHAATGTPPDELYPLRRWFRSLFEKAAADRDAGDASVFVRGARVAEALLADPRDVRVLHGDIHHANIRHSPRGWLAFDPKGLLGERTYDTANTLCNLIHWNNQGDNEARLLRSAALLAERLQIDLPRVLAYTFAYSCLSAAWSFGGPEVGDEALGIAALVEKHVRL